MSTKTKKNRIRELSARYPRVIEWSPEDGVFVGSAPPLVGQCCHGSSEQAVARQLAVIVEDLAEDVLDGKMPDPPLEDARNEADSACLGIGRKARRTQRTRNV